MGQPPKRRQSKLRQARRRASYMRRVTRAQKNYEEAALKWSAKHGKPVDKFPVPKPRMAQATSAASGASTS